MTSPLRIYIGWDQREPIAYDVAKFSLERRASIPVEIMPIKLDELRARKLYWRTVDPLASTEFTYSRFLTPALAGFRGWALFIDCDFLWLGDIAGLARIHAHAEGGLLRAARLSPEGDHQDGRRGADDLSAQELVVVHAVQLRSPGGARLDARGREHADRRLSAPHAMGARRRRSARCRSNGTGSRAGTRSPRTARRARCISPAADRGSRTGRTSTTAICGGRNATHSSGRSG